MQKGEPEIVIPYVSFSSLITLQKLDEFKREL